MADGKPTYADVLVLRSLLLGAAAARRREAARRSRRLSRQDRLRRHDGAPGCDDLFTSRSRPARCRACRCTPASWTTSCPARFIAPAAVVGAARARARRGRWPASLAIAPRGLARAGCRVRPAWRLIAAGRPSALFARGAWAALTEPLLGVALAAFGGVAYQYFVEGREKRKVKQLFSRYVSKDVYDQLMADPALAKLGGQRREMSVLFSDIRGLHHLLRGRRRPRRSSRSSTSTSRGWWTWSSRTAARVDKFVGDMVMALFGAPLDDPDHADHAVQAALDDGRGAARAERGWAAEGRPTLDIGVGINSGDMVAGNIGSRDDHELHGDRRRGEPRLAPRVAEQAVRHRRSSSARRRGPAQRAL